MIIVDIVAREDGTVVAYVAEDDGTPVGVNVYSPESYPRPELGTIEEAGVFRRAWRWITGG